MEKNEGLNSLTLHSDRIKLADGRYLIYYTFDDAAEDHISINKPDDDPDENCEN